MWLIVCSTVFCCGLGSWSGSWSSCQWTPLKSTACRLFLPACCACFACCMQRCMPLPCDDTCTQGSTIGPALERLSRCGSRSRRVPTSRSARQPLLLVAHPLHLHPSFQATMRCARADSDHAAVQWDAQPRLTARCSSLTPPRLPRPPPASMCPRTTPRWRRSGASQHPHLPSCLPSIALLPCPPLLDRTTTRW